MKNIIKTAIVMLSSLSLFTSVNAGELSVTGTAKATYNILSGHSQNVGKGMGVANEFNLGASGELDNGYTWGYNIAFDPNNTAGGTNGEVQNDDSSLTLTTPQGTVGVFIKTGGLDVEDGASQSVYGRPTDIGDPSATVDNWTIDSYNSFQYHSPAGLLPFGLAAKVAYAPSLDGNQNSANATPAGAATDLTTSMGSSATEMQIKAAPIDGLAIGASYISFDNSGTNDSGNGALLKQSPESGAVYASYTQGPASVGYSRAKAASLLSTATLTDTTAEFYDQTNMSIAYNVNDALSVSYEIEESIAEYVTAATASIKSESDAIQAAYTMGGMTLAVSYAKHDNFGYVLNQDASQALFAVSMAF